MRREAEIRASKLAAPSSASADLAKRVERAIEARRELAATLAPEGTDAYRLFHGVAEGRPGLTIDRYGALVLAQTFREPLTDSETREIERVVRAHLGRAIVFACNHRGESAAAPEPRRSPDDEASEFMYREFGVRHVLRARHRGQDPWLFLDLRAGRRRLRALAPQKSVLNLFAYTCGAGLAALAAGASEVWNVDFAASSLAVGRRDLELNGWDERRMHFVQEDCIPILRQLAGLPIKGRGARRTVVRVEPRSFDIVFLDPPAWSAGPFGAIDVERDYAGLFKPALLVTAEGGTVIATHHVARVELDAWIAALERCAAKAGRPIRALETLAPEADFPTFDGKSPLKIAVCSL